MLRPALALVALLVCNTASAQDIPAAPIPPGNAQPPVVSAQPAPVAPPIAPPVAPMQPAPATPAAALYKEYQKVEVADAENPGMWNTCTVITVFTGAYEVSCNYTHSIVRDVHVRKPGGQPQGQTAAQAVTGPPFKAGDIVLGTIMGLPDDWRLCVILRNQLQSSNGYVAKCGRSEMHLLPKWVRADPDAPQ
ncbi:hypothetical protein [Sphingomonas soli]|uniref:hypothetical protein n=1 Tax=Sphingomonas soli TaxID=266127 RepID=UPI000A7424FC|nr:hypothetical protein [Sphingomonas soli]